MADTDEPGEPSIETRDPQAEMGKPHALDGRETDPSSASDASLRPRASRESSEEPPITDAVREVIEEYGSADTTEIENEVAILLEPFPEQERPTIGLLLSQTLNQKYHGPLPPPTWLAQYNEAEPGAAGRILKMAEDNARHRRTMDLRAVDAETEIVRQTFRTHARGQWMVAGMVGALIVAVIIAIINEQNPVGIALVAAALVAFVGSYFWMRSPGKGGEGD